MKPLISPCEEEVEGTVKEGHSMSQYISETAWPSRVGREAGEELSRKGVSERAFISDVSPFGYPFFVSGTFPLPLILILMEMESNLLSRRTRSQSRIPTRS